MPKVALYGLHLLANIFLISAFDRSVLPLFYRFSAKRSAGILIVFTAIFIVLRQIYKNGKYRGKNDIRDRNKKHIKR